MPTTKLEHTAFTERPATLRSGTVASLAEILYKSGPKAVVDELVRHWGKVSGDTSLIPPDHRDAVERRGREETGDQYYDYSPPTLWQPPYQVLRVRFKRGKKSEFMTHVGEEVIIPVSEGGIVYSMLMPDVGAEGFALKRVDLAPLHKGEIMRVQPAVPHYTGCDKETAEAWVAFRDLGFSAVAIRSKKPLGLGLEARVRGEAHYRENPDLYCMAAFGVSERIRLFRDTAGLQISELARMAELDRAHLSKVESADSNISILKLKNIGEQLGFDPSEAFRRELWGHKRAKLKSTPGPHPAAISDHNPRHYLHIRYLNLRAGEEYKQDLLPGQERLLDTMSSWIALRGAARFFIADRLDQGVMVDAGAVLHLRKPEKLKVCAVESAQFLEITFSPLCVCDRPKNGG